MNDANITTIASLTMTLDASLMGVSAPEDNVAANDTILVAREMLGKLLEVLKDPSIKLTFDGKYLRPPTTNFRRTANWLTKCGKVPGTVDASVQYGVHVEEFAELLDDTGFADMTGVTAVVANEASRLLKHVGETLKSRGAHIVVHDRESFLDALSDGEVTGNGVAFLMGMDKEGHDAEVLFKNDDKFQDGEPVILPGGKIGKRKGWTPPDAAPFVGVMPEDPPVAIEALKEGDLEDAVRYVGSHFKVYDPSILAGALAPVIDLARMQGRRQARQHAEQETGQDHQPDPSGD